MVLDNRNAFALRWILMIRATHCRRGHRFTKWHGRNICKICLSAAVRAWRARQKEGKKGGKS